MHVPQQPSGSYTLNRLRASQNGDGMTVCNQRRYQVASDEAGPPSDDDLHHHPQFNSKRSVLLEGSLPVLFLSSDKKFIGAFEGRNIHGIPHCLKQRARENVIDDSFILCIRL